MNLPTLSVIIPNYNHAHHLPRCLEALLGQSVQPHEIIVIDDGSTDNSVEVIRGFADKYPVIKLLQNDRNQGVTFTVNRGIDEARSEFVYLQASDDVILPGFFEKSLQLLARHPHAGLSCTIGDWRELHTGVCWHMGAGMADQPAYLSPREVVSLEHQGRFFIPGHTAIYRRDALVKVGKLIPELGHYSDWFSTTTLALRHGVCVVPEPLAICNIEPNTYFQRSRRDREKNEAAIEHALKLLMTPAFSDVVELFERAGSLYICGWGTYRVVRGRREYRRFLTPRYLRKMVWHASRLWLKQRAPAFLINWYVGVAGYRVRTAKLLPKKVGD